MTKEEQPKLWSLSFLNVCIANFLMASSFNLLMPSIPLYVTEHMGVAQSKTGIVLASYAIALMVVRPFSGYLVDRFPRKKLFLIGLISFVLTFFGYFWASTVLLFILVRFVHGMTWGMTTVSASTMAIDVVPSTRRAEGIGYYGTFNNVAMAVGPFIAIYIYQHLGFQYLLACAIGMGILGIISVMMIKAPERECEEKKLELSLDRFFLLKSWPIFLNQLLPTIAWGTIPPFVMQYGLAINISNPGVFFLFWASGVMLTRIFSGKLVDKGWMHEIMVVSMALVAISLLVFATVHTLYMFCIASLGMGIGFGLMLPALQTLYINMASNSQRGTASSTYLIGFDTGLAIGMLMGGFVSGHFSFETLYKIGSGLCFLSIFIYWFISRRVFEQKKMR